MRSVCCTAETLSQGVKMSFGNPISTFPAGNQRPGLSCLAFPKPVVVVVVDVISVVTLSCQLSRHILNAK
jgi:hypothetical protein